MPGAAGLREGVLQEGFGRKVISPVQIPLVSFATAISKPAHPIIVDIYILEVLPSRLLQRLDGMQARPRPKGRDTAVATARFIPRRAFLTVDCSLKVGVAECSEGPNGFD